MRKLTGRFHRGVFGCVMVSLGALWMTPLWAEKVSTPPRLKELIERKSDLKAEPGSATSGIPDDQLGRGTPQSSVREYLTSARERNYLRAAEYLDLRNLPAGLTESQGPELARQLRIVLDRTLWIDLELLSTNPDGDQTDNLPAVRDRVGHIAAETKTYDLLIQHVPRGDGVYIWKFADVTVAEIPELYQQFGYGRLEHIFPAWLFDSTVLGFNLWISVATIILSIVMYPVAMLLTKLAVMILRRMNAELAEQFERLLGTPFTLLIWTVLIRSAAGALFSSVTLAAIMQARTIQTIFLAWLLMRVIDLVVERAATNLDRKGLGGSRILITPVGRLVKFVVLAGAILLWLDNAGYRVTTLLAGLSISGIAVALASQKSLENIFGAITLFAGRPVKVGDFCRFGNHVGTVEEIGLRATRIRTLDRTVITVSNAEFANMHLDNFSERDRFWYHPSLHLRHETTPDQIRCILVEIRKMLYAHPKILTEPLHVRFRGFGEYSLDIEVFAYIGVIDYTESLEIAEDLNLRTMDIVKMSGSDFALPAAIQYTLPGRLLDEDQARAVSLQVKEWKSKRELYLPNFPPDKIASIKGSLDYPPEGSPQYVPARA